MTVENIIQKAVLLGACKKTDKATDWKSLCELFFSPQGREFCKRNEYPSLEMFREMKSNVEPYGVIIEENIKCVNKDVAVINGTADLTYHGTDKAYKLILMYGSTVHIKIGNYAVLRIENTNGSYTIENDGTGRIL